MEAAISNEPAEIVDRCNEMQELRPEHIRVVALRLQGKRWSEIAAELGVTPPTVWRWRQDNPEIDEIIRQESQDYLESSKHGLARLVPKAVAALECALVGSVVDEAMEEVRGLMLSGAPAELIQERLQALRDEVETLRREPSPQAVAAARYVIDKFSRAGELQDKGGPIGKAARLPDDALDAALDGGPEEPKP